MAGFLQEICFQTYLKKKKNTNNNHRCLCLVNKEPTLLVHCLYQMSSLNHKRTTSSLAPPIFYVAKNSAIKRQNAPHYQIKIISQWFKYLNSRFRFESRRNKNEWKTFVCQTSNVAKKCTFHELELAHVRKYPIVNFINFLRANFFVQMSFLQLFLVTFWLWGEICTKNLRVKC